MMQGTGRERESKVPEAERKETEGSLGREVRRRLSSRGISCKAFWKRETDSTNVWAKEWASENREEELPVLFMAERQTAGRGRFQRDWISPPGENLYMTLLLERPEMKIEKASQLTLVMGLSAAQGVNRLLGEKAGIKWPNDVVLSGKKICGILTEMRIERDRPQYIIIGTGININQKAFSEELSCKATSLALETGRMFDRAEAAAETLTCFFENYRRFLKAQSMEPLRQEYEELLLNKDQEVRILEKGEESLGIARGITNQGELLVEDEKGGLRKIFSGEVSVRGLYSYV